MTRRIEATSYKPEWPERFEEEARELASIFGDEIVATHHIGSTAIPGISAKPIIDILVEVRDIERIDDFNAEMVARGYVPKGEFGIPRRRFFIKGSETARTHHIHVFEVGNPESVRHLAFRDHLRTHAEAAQAYSRLKEELARRFPHDIDAYIAGKDGFVEEIERKALAWRTDRELEDNR